MASDLQLTVNIVNRHKALSSHWPRNHHCADMKINDHSQRHCCQALMIYTRGLGDGATAVCNTRQFHDSTLDYNTCNSTTYAATVACNS